MLDDRAKVTEFLPQRPFADCHWQALADLRNGQQFTHSHSLPKRPSQSLVNRRPMSVTLGINERG